MAASATPITIHTSCGWPAPITLRTAALCGSKLDEWHKISFFNRFFQMDARTRYLFTSVMHSNNCVAIQQADGSLVKYYLHPPTGQRSLKKLMLAAFPGFQKRWLKYIDSDTGRTRPHILLEQADNNKEIDAMNLLLNGQLFFNDTCDPDLKDFLHYYVLHAQVNWTYICNATNCFNTATKTCGKCKIAKYCSIECQKADWRLSHKRSCEMLCEPVVDTPRGASLFSMMSLS